MRRPTDQRTDRAAAEGDPMIRSRMLSHVRSIVPAAGVFALVGGAVSFSGWVLDVPSLTDWFNDGVSIQPNTSLLLVLSGTALILLFLGYRRMMRVLGGVIGAVGALTLLQYIVGADFG